MDDFPVDQFVLGGIKDRVSLARAIDEKEHLFQKTQHEDNWLKRTAAEADLDVDEMM